MCFSNASVRYTAGGVQLFANVITSVAGFVAFELRNASTPIAGYELESADRLKGNAIAAAASWRSGSLSTLAPLSGQAVHVHVALADARLFSLRLDCQQEEQ